MRYLLLFVIILGNQFIFGQSQITIGILQFDFPTLAEYRKANKKEVLAKRLQSNYEQDFDYVRSAQNYVTQQLLADSRFQVIDRANLNLISNELEATKARKFFGRLHGRTR